jgi:hypothetical protein
MGKCPICEETVPAAVEQCEFCGASLRRDPTQVPSGLWSTGARARSVDEAPEVIPNGQPTPAAIPDRIPEELIEHYGEDARKAVRRRRSRPRKRRTGPRPATSSLRNGDVWLLALMFFGSGIIGAAFLAAMVYAITLAPWVALYVVLPMALLFGGSLFLAMRVNARKSATESLEHIS